jgi:hypothetical protein
MSDEISGSIFRAIHCSNDGGSKHGVTSQKTAIIQTCSFEFSLHFSSVSVRDRLFPNRDIIYGEISDRRYMPEGDGVAGRGDPASCSKYG